MKKAIDYKTQKEIDISALLDAFVYMDRWELIEDPYSADGISLAEACDKLDDQNLNEEQRSFLKTIQITLDNHPEYGDIRLLDQNADHLDLARHNYAFSKDHLIASTFRWGDDYYVAYRGTGEGKWIDNAEAFTQEASSMQEAAREYFDYVVETYGLTEAEGRIIVTGHSKGGNSAQYVTMYSDYAEIIDNCYSLDGQGFSQEAIKAFKNRWSGEYENQVRKIYSINGEYDYVHDLGIPIIPEDQTYFVRCFGSGMKGDGNNLIAFHDLRYMLAADGSLNWDCCEDGSLNIEYPQSDFGLFVKGASEKLMMLDDSNLNDVAITIMSFLEITIGGGVGTGDISMMTTDEFEGFLLCGIPLLLVHSIGSGYTGDALSDCFQKLPSGGMPELVIEPNNDMPFQSLFINWTNERSLEEIQELLSPENIGKVAALGAAYKDKMVITSEIADGIPVFPGSYFLVQMLYTKAYVDFFIEHGEEIGNGIEYTVEKLSNAMQAYVEGRINMYVSVTFVAAEVFITNILKEVGGIADWVYANLDEMEQIVKTGIKVYLAMYAPHILVITSFLSSFRRYDLEVNVKRLRNAVKDLNEIVTRVQNMDSRLNTLYTRLAKNNVEMEEGVFTSLANLYNLLSADICVDQAGAVRRRAASLQEFLDEGDAMERKFLKALD